MAERPARFFARPIERPLRSTLEARAAVLRCCLLICIAAATCMMPAGVLAADAAPPITIDRGSFLVSPDATPPADDAPWQVVTLPDIWELTRPAFRGNAWYRFDLDLASTPPHGTGFYIEISRTQTELYVNGRYAGASGIIDGTAPDRIGFSQLYVVPGTHLRQGANRLHLRVFRPGSGGGLSQIRFGSYPTLYYQWNSRFIETFGGYALVGVTITTIGVFVLALWIQRRSQSEYFYLGAGALVWGVHSLFRLLPGQSFPLHYTVLWHFTNLLSVALLTIFCLRFAQRKWKGFERLVWICTALLLPVFYATSSVGSDFLGWLPQTTEIAQQVYNVFVLGALLGVILRVRKDHRMDSWLLLLGAASYAAPRLVPWIRLPAHPVESLDSLSLTPASIFAFVLIAGWILIERFVRTASDLERLNVQLELRVAEKSQELQAQLNATEAAREEAERANLAKSRFLAAASHDLRQPLHALGLFAAALDENTHDAKGRNLVGHINQSIGALDMLFNGVLDVSKLDAGAVSASIRNVALQRVFDRIGDELWASAEDRMLRLRLRPTDVVVRTDPVLIERILRNLVHNAIRYTNQGGVLIGARRRGSRVSLEVWDTGIGIGPEHQTRIFEEFYQVGNPQRDRTQGLGLGLAIVKRLCDLLDHPLSVRSELGRGSVFRLSLPLAESPADADSNETLHVAGSEGELLAGKMIAIVDDEPSVREGMGALLVSWRCEAIVASNEIEATSLLESASRKPDLLIVDYRLDDRVVGIDVIRTLRRRLGDDIPAIIVSGESSPAELSRIMESGFPMLHKPVTPAKLRSMIAYLLADLKAIG
jgi:signal transduction histidine kinase/CheY-like chemotaxis protein